MVIDSEFCRAVPGTRACARETLSGEKEEKKNDDEATMAEARRRTRRC